MALSDAECNQCQIELDKLKAQYEGAGQVPDVAKARLSELESALDSECSSSGSSDYGAGAVVAGLAGLGVLAALLAWVFGSRQ